MMELLIGCGNSRKKKISVTGFPTEWEKLVTLDHDKDCDPDVVHDLDQLPYPFTDNQFDEIHAYEVLEHCGRQGDWRFFFAQFTEFHRILKPGGVMVATVPMWDAEWAWADPGHTRIITRNSLIFLDQREYGQVGETDITDYRAWYKANFELIGHEETKNKLIFVLRAIKGDVKHTTKMQE